LVAVMIENISNNGVQGVRDFWIALHRRVGRRMARLPP
jgi:hypothetical protein